MGSKSLPILLLTIIFSLFTSCEDTKPFVLDVYPQLIFDTESNDMVLSLYGSFSSDPFSIKKMKIFHEESEIFWKTESVECIQPQKNSVHYVGFSAFIGLNQGFPKGKYEVTFYDEANRETSTQFEITETFSKKDVEKIENQKQFIALYGSDDSILTVKECDILDEEMKNKIISDYEKCVNYRFIIKDIDTNLLYLLKINNIKDEN